MVCEARATICDSPDVLTNGQSLFLANHMTEIEDIYSTGIMLKPWDSLGSGVSKTSYTHPDLPGSIVKMAYRKKALRKDTDNDVRTHYMHLQNAKDIVCENNFRHIKIPKSVLVETTPGPIVVEEKFELMNTLPSNPLTKDAYLEFDSFKEKSGICDVTLCNFSPEFHHNAGFLNASEENPQIGIFDFDCHVSREAADNTAFERVIRDLERADLRGFSGFIVSLGAINMIARAVLGNNRASAVMLIGAGFGAGFGGGFFPELVPGLIAGAVLGGTGLQAFALLAKACLVFKSKLFNFRRLA